MDKGSLIGDRYRIGAVIEETELGVLVRARHLALDDAVLVKIMSDRVRDARLAAKFLREARNSARVKSEHVARFIDVGTLPDGRPYLVMEDLQGESLDNVIHASRLAEAEAATFVIEACEALAAAHSVGIVHRELRTSSLFLARSAAGVSAVKVMGFGSPRVVDSTGREEDAGLTVAGLRSGVPDYASPETFIRPTVDHRTDVWSLGIVLFEILSGVRPFSGTNEAVVKRILVEPPPSLLAKRPDLSPGLEDVVLGCLGKRPEERFADMASLAQALAPFATDSGRVTARRIMPASATLPESTPRLATGDDFSEPTETDTASLPSLVPGEDETTTIEQSLHQRVAGGGLETLSYDALRSVAPPASAAPTRPRSRLPLVVGVFGLILLALGVERLVRREFGSQAAPLASAVAQPAARPVGSQVTIDAPPPHPTVSTHAPPESAPAATESAQAATENPAATAPIPQRRAHKPRPRQPAPTAPATAAAPRPTTTPDPWGWNR